MKTDQKMDHAIYITGWCIFGILFVYLLMKFVFDIHITTYMVPCVFYRITGYYCPGCGGTRAVRTLMQGELIQSFFYHPLVIYAAAVSGWFMISQTVEHLSCGRLKIGMHYRDCYLWAALGLVAVNFLIKNAVLIFWQIDPLAF